MEAQRTVTVSLPAKVVEELDKMAREENTTRSQILRTAIDQYSRSGRIWRQIYKWSEEAARKLGIKTEEDVDRIIHEQ